MTTMEQSPVAALPVLPSAPVPATSSAAYSANNSPAVKHPKALPADFFYYLTLGAVIALLFTPLFYRISRMVIYTFTNAVQGREYITENGVSYSPVTLFTRLAEQPNVNEVFIGSKDLVRTIPENIGNLTTLKRLYIFQNPVRSLPATVGNLTSLQHIGIQNTRLTSLPTALANNQQLVDLSLQGNNISRLPDIFGSLQNLEVLNLAHNNLTSLPPSMSNLSKLILLDLTGNKLTSVPQNLPPSLEVLFLGGNPIPIRKLEEAQLKYSLTQLIIYY